MKRVIVDNQYTYETKLDLSVGDEVILNTPDYLRDVLGDTWIGRVTSLESDYKGDCSEIFSKV